MISLEVLFRPKEIAHIFTADCLNHVIRRCTKKFSDDGELVYVYKPHKQEIAQQSKIRKRTIFPGEQWFPFKHLCKDATCTPDIYSDIIFLPGQHDLRRSVIPCRNISCHLGILDSSQAEITDLKMTLLLKVWRWRQHSRDSPWDHNSRWREYYSVSMIMFKFRTWGDTKGTH